MITKNSRILYGAGGHAGVLLDVAKSCGLTFECIIDQAPQILELAGVPVVAAASVDFAQLKSIQFIVAIGNNSARRKVFNDLRNFGNPLILIHPFTCISSRAIIGRGVAVMPGVVVNTGTEIGDNVILNTSCSVDHDCIIGDHSHICPGVHLAGNVVVGAGTMIGTGAAVIPGIKIGENCTIGAGAVVVRDIPDGSVAYGSPCRVASCAIH